MEYSAMEFNKIFEWKDIKIDLNDPRLKNYIFFENVYGSLCILNKVNFNLVKLMKNDKSGEYKLYSFDDKNMATFKDINLFLKQLIRG